MQKTSKREPLRLKNWNTLGNMPSKSKSQQRLMGVAYAVKSGDMQLSDVDSAYRDDVKGLVDGMTLKQLKDFASTKHEDLPEKIKEAIDLGKVQSNMKSITQKEWDKTNKEYKTVINGQKYKMVYDDGRDATILIPVIIEEDLAAVVPPMLGGMGNVVLPNVGALGSGDAPAGQGDAEEEYKKKKRKAKILSMEEFVNEQKKQVKPFDPSKNADGEELGEDGYESGSNPLPDQEALQKEMARRKVSGVVAMKFESFINR